MKVEEIKSVVDDIPMMTVEQAQKITSFIRSKNLKNLLEYETLKQIPDLLEIDIGHIKIKPEKYDK